MEKDDIFGHMDARLSHTPKFSGEGFRFKFANGYGASCIRHEFSYGGDEGLWELAVLKFDKRGNGKLTYDTPITNDVIGYLNVEQVKDLLDRIESL